MSFVVENGSVILLYGKQDCDAWVAKIDLQGLLQSLVPVETTVEINSYYGSGKGPHGGPGLEGQLTEGERQGFGREEGRRSVPFGASASGSGSVGASTSASTSAGAGMSTSSAHSSARRLTKRLRQSAAV